MQKIDKTKPEHAHIPEKLDGFELIKEDRNEQDQAKGFLVTRPELAVRPVIEGINPDVGILLNEVRKMAGPSVFLDLAKRGVSFEDHFLEVYKDCAFLGIATDMEGNYLGFHTEDVGYIKHDTETLTSEELQAKRGDHMEIVNHIKDRADIVAKVPPASQE